MYSQHFGLKQDPFSIAPDPRYLFMSQRHREALAHLLYGVGGSGRVAGGGFVLLTGDIGTGKTTICRCFLQQIPGTSHVAYIFNPKLTVAELLQSVGEEFNIPLPASATQVGSVKSQVDALNAFLLNRHAAGQSCVIIIDEAQNLSPDVLEQLRLLTNLETNEHKLLQIVLIGQPELRLMLQRPELEQLAQRVIARFHLGALNAAESVGYIQHRLAVAGHTGSLPFDSAALQRIHHLSQGVPRRINLLCGRALLGTWATGQQRVTRRIVNQAARELFGSDAAPAQRSSNARSPLTTTILLGAVVGTVCGVATLAAGWWADKHGWSNIQNTVKGNSANSLALPAQTAALPTPSTASASPSASTPIPVSGASQPAPPATAPARTEELAAILTQLPRDINTAWHHLAALWQPRLDRPTPCMAPGTEPGPQCIRAGNLTLPQLRQLGRMGILTLRLDNHTPAYAYGVLVGLNDQYATLQLGERRFRTRLSALGQVWDGEFSTYWQAPLGYSAPLPEGSTGTAVDQLVSQLDQVEGQASGSGATADTAPPRHLDAALRARVKAFQRRMGLHPDGVCGPLTFMQLESATGSTQARLVTDTP